MFASRFSRILGLRQTIVALVLFSMVAGALVLPRRYMPFLREVEAAPPISTSAGSMTALNAAYTENFDTLANSGTSAVAWTDNTTLPGWYSTRPTYLVGTGSLNTGSLYSFGVTGANPITDRALGSVGSSGTGAVYWGVRLTNNTGSQITSLDLAYMGEQWRNGGATAPALSVSQLVDFQFQVASVGAVTGINTPATGWQDYDTLDFSSPSEITSVTTTISKTPAAWQASAIFERSVTWPKTLGV